MYVCMHAWVHVGVHARMGAYVCVCDVMCVYVCMCVLTCGPVSTPVVGGRAQADSVPVFRHVLSEQAGR